MEFLYQTDNGHSGENIGCNLYLLTNGLGGYSSLSAAFSAPRTDQGILVAAQKAPNVRINLVHRISEKLICGADSCFLSAQDFADGEASEDGTRYLRSFSFEYTPVWIYEVHGVTVTRRCCIPAGENTAAVLYTIENPTSRSCTLALTPFFKFAPKEDAVTERKTFTYDSGKVYAGGHSVNIRTDGVISETDARWQTLAYPEDARDGRPNQGVAGACCRITRTIQPGETASLEIVFSTKDAPASGWEILCGSEQRMRAMEERSGFQDPAARQLALAADAFISHRDSTGGKTLLAGYPLFSDWGRDTMIALPGCCLSTGRYEDARSILRTFLAYEKDGLVPNLFPEGDQAPMYNTVDAALLLIDSIWQYVQRTGDLSFAREAWETMERIIACYRKGTQHGIGMDADGLIYAGKGLDQVTWMDVCVDGVLPTPRHGKPVEINAYWYNALRIMDALAEALHCDRKDYAKLAQTVQRSFVEQFYMPEKGYLKDVISGTDADEQIRCNQIWALSMPFTMLNPQQERAVLDTVRTHLYTPYGLRTLSPQDSQFRPYYGGEQFQRDMAYHQGTVWVFPMGAYYRAYLKVHGNTPQALKTVREGLANVPVMLRQGCAGQLPEIYDGINPREGKGCFAQAWSVGEILRVYEIIETLE